ncbi:MAG TPA: hypothetical protein ENH82_10925 [bacterium]|nr:hypothetical protein [bacterium]
MKQNVRVGKTIMADTGRLRRRNCGVIEQVNETTNEVFIYAKNNPEGYKHYVISFSDCVQWFNQGLYT